MGSVWAGRHVTPRPAGGPSSSCTPSWRVAARLDRRYRQRGQGCGARNSRCRHDRDRPRPRHQRSRPALHRDGSTWRAESLERAIRRRGKLPFGEVVQIVASELAARAIRRRTRRASCTVISSPTTIFYWHTRQRRADPSWATTVQARSISASPRSCKTKPKRSRRRRRLSRHGCSAPPHYMSHRSASPPARRSGARFGHLVARGVRLSPLPAGRVPFEGDANSVTCVLKVWRRADSPCRPKARARPAQRSSYGWVRQVLCSRDEDRVTFQ